MCQNSEAFGTERVDLFMYTEASVIIILVFVAAMYLFLAADLSEKWKIEGQAEKTNLGV